MLKFEWNSLRVGDAVLVHGPDTSEMVPVPGVVTTVNTEKRQNGVGIRVPAGSGAVVLWPARLAVHRPPRDPGEPCRRCEPLSDR